MRNLLIIIMISMLAGVCACSEDPAELIIEPSEPTIEELEAKVVENCHILLEAIEAYKVASASYHWKGTEIYPPSISTDPYELGITLIEFLPNGELLENPFTGEKTEPSTDTVATEPGQIGYGVLSLLGANQVYAITGCGEDSLVALLNNIREVEVKILSDCFLVQYTFQKYIETLFEYIVIKDDFISLFPGGSELMNHLTHSATNPQFGHLSMLEGDISVYCYLIDPAADYEIRGNGVYGYYEIFHLKVYHGETEAVIHYTDEVVPILDIISRFHQVE